MTPQPAAAPAEQTPAQRQIARAKTLERDRAALATKVSANRDYLRLMAANDELNAAEAKWLAAFYPEKEKGERRSAEEVEETRKVKEAARKGE
jgi:hypothetical protein